MVAEDQNILRHFLDAAGRLKQIPVKRAKLLVVLAHLAAAFEPGRRYPERAVNEILKRFHPDFCTLRRDLVDFQFLGREGGEYWLLTPPPQES
jgi:hypothetical protein